MLLCWFLPGLFPATAAAQADLEYEVKAAFLVNFTRFIDWPEEAFPDPLAPFVIGVLGRENPFSNGLELAVQGRTVGERPLQTRHGQTLDEIGDVQILFISRLEAVAAGPILAQLESKPVLTVGDTPDFTAAGGMIRFFLRNGRIGLEINRQEADKAGLRISSRLLSLADIYGD